MMQVVLASLLANHFAKTTLGPKTKKVLMHDFDKIQIIYIIYLFNNTLSSQLKESVYSLTKKIAIMYLFELYLYEYTTYIYFRQFKKAYCIIQRAILLLAMKYI
jgi:hypothetical protein